MCIYDSRNKDSHISYATAWQSNNLFAFQCNKKRIVDYPNIWGYLRDLYNTPGFGDTTNPFHIEHHYMVHNIINGKIITYL